MYQFVRTLSHLLELDRPELTADDLADLGDEHHKLLPALNVLVPTRNARYVVCDACHDDHIEEVIRTKSHGGKVTFHNRCPNAGWVLVPDRRVRRWTVDVSRLVSMLSGCIGVGAALEPLVENAAWRLGQVEIAGEHFAVVLARSQAETADTLLSCISAKHPRPRTILIGAGDLQDAAGFAAIASLSTAFKITDQQFAFQLSNIRSVMEVSESLLGNVFRQIAEYWRISFDGRTAYLRDSVGLNYLGRLLAAPNRQIPAVVLAASRVGVDPRIFSGSQGEFLDDDALAHLTKQYKELTEELEEARDHNDFGRAPKLEEQLEVLGATVLQATGFNHRRREKTDAEKVRVSVTMAVTRDIARIGKHNPTLAQHLDAFIESGYMFRYIPVNPIDWLT